LTETASLLTIYPVQPIPRRTLLAYGATAAAGLAVGGFGLWEVGAVTDVDALERAVLSLDGRCDRLGARPTFAEGRMLFALLDDVRPYPARAVCRLSLTMARAARWSRQDPSGWIRLALDAAKESGDGPLLARCWTQRAIALGEDTRARGVGAGPEMRGLLDAAAVRAGSDHDTRADAHYRLAFEHAAAGQRADARAALTRAEKAAQLAGWTDAGRGDCSGAALWVLDELGEAELALSEGTAGWGTSRLFSFANLARVHLDGGSPDAALEDILQADHDARGLGRQDLAPHLRTTALLLPRRLRTIALDHIDG
jgi:hypothetical protein